MGATKPSPVLLFIALFSRLSAPATFSSRCWAVWDKSPRHARATGSVPSLGRSSRCPWEDDEKISMLPTCGGFHSHGDTGIPQNGWFIMEHPSINPKWLIYNGTSIYKWMIARGTPSLVNPNIWNISHNVEMKCGYYMISWYIYIYGS